MENESSVQVPGRGSSRGDLDSPSARDSPNPAPAGWAEVWLLNSVGHLLNQSWTLCINLWVLVKWEVKDGLLV